MLELLPILAAAPQPGELPPLVRWFIFGVWLPLTLFCFVFFRFNHNGRLKQRVAQVLLVVGPILMLAFVAFGMPGDPKVALYLAAPFAALTWLNLRITKFCPKCGERQQGNLLREPPKLCSSCGAVFPSPHTGRDTPAGP